MDGQQAAAEERMTDSNGAIIGSDGTIDGKVMGWSNGSDE
jgi:hypothetical protein